MKKIFVSIAALAALASCSKEEAGVPGNGNGNETERAAIAPSAAIENNVVSRAAVEGTAFAAGADVFRLCAFLSGDNAPTDWSVAAGTEAFEQMQVNCTGEGKLSLATPKYYPPTGENAQKLWFYAYAPPLYERELHFGKRCDQAVRKLYDHGAGGHHDRSSNRR